jgi:hypothetical protein
MASSQIIPQSLNSSPGWVRYGDILIQWGTNVVTTSASGEFTISFPVSFNTPFTVMACNGDFNVGGSGSDVGVRNLTQSSFTFKAFNVNNLAFRVNWIAVGN